MKNTSFYRGIILLIMMLVLVGCADVFTPLATPQPQATPPENDIQEGEALVTPLPPQPETMINFRVQIPAETPPGEIIYLTVLDEVTGLALNATHYPMYAVEPSSTITSAQDIHSYTYSLPFKIGSVIKYRYERQAESIRVAEHLSNGSPVRYRMFYVDAPGGVSDVVSRWTDTPYTSPTGRITGQAIDSESGLPIPNLLITAGGGQTFTTADGSFLLEGLPPGVHNLIAYAMDGAYQTFQQGADVAEGAMTPALLNLTPATMVNVMFVVKPPQDTPPIVPLRLAGNLYQLGNSFGNLTGGVSTLAVNMPVMDPSLPDGRYNLIMSLPVGADIRYKYTLGDGLWNAEHAETGEFKIRQVIVPDHNVLIEDEIETWHMGPAESLTFDVTVPAETPPGDYIAIQFNPLFGWTESIPMWKLGENRWGYILHSPLNLPGNFSYRYCRNGQCGTADDAETPGIHGAGRPLKIGSESLVLDDQVTAWVGLDPTMGVTSIPTSTVNTRGQHYWAGAEFLADHHPSWNQELPTALDEVAGLGSNLVVLSPTWTFTRNSPPVLQPVAGQDASWFDLRETARQASDRGLNLALKPTPQFPIPEDEWWQQAPRDFSWWLVWFDQYRIFALNYADMAAETGVSGIILGGEFLAPALPNGVLADGTPSGVPEDAETRWRNLLTEVRSRYDGQILWALPYHTVRNAPAFLDAVDQIYLLWPTPEGEPVASQDLQTEISSQLVNVVWPIRILMARPFILAVSYPSDPDMQTQIDYYNALLNAANQHNWINGFVSRGFYPPAIMRDKSSSIHGKPTSDLLSYWFPRLLGLFSP